MTAHNAIMPEDLPIYSDSILRTRLQFTDLEKLRGLDASAIWEKSDHYISQMEGAANLPEARSIAADGTKAALLAVHGILFSGKPGAGQLRQTSLMPIYRGQDYPDPEFIDRSLDNFFSWFSAESLAEIHPIEKAALVLTRILDIWPFEFGNFTAALVFANATQGIFP